MDGPVNEHAGGYLPCEPLELPGDLDAKNRCRRSQKYPCAPGDRGWLCMTDRPGDQRGRLPVFGFAATRRVLLVDVQGGPQIAQLQRSYSCSTFIAVPGCAGKRPPFGSAPNTGFFSFGRENELVRSEFYAPSRGVGTNPGCVRPWFSKIRSRESSSQRCCQGRWRPSFSHRRWWGGSH